MEHDSEHTVAVDLGGTHIRCAVVDDQLNLLGKQDAPTPHDAGPAGVMDRIAAMARRAAHESAVDWRRICGLAVATPGPLNARTGMVFAPPNLTGWRNVPLRSELEARLGIPASIVNDANAAAMGEFTFGAGRDVQHMVYLTISTGIGGGVISSGRLIEGALGTAGEIGHMTIDRHGPICKCGNVGCLEAIASGTGLARRINAALAAGEPTEIRQWVTGRPATAEDVARAAAAGDALACDMFLDAAEAIGIGVVNCIHLFNPEVIALGGGVTKAGELLFGPVRHTVNRFALEQPRSVVQIVPAQLKDDVGLIGAAIVSRQLVEADPGRSSRT